MYFDADDYCHSPFHSNKGCMNKMCREYSEIMNDCVDKLDAHLDKLWEMLENE